MTEPQEERHQDTAEPKTYRGNCHCKAYVFELKLPEIKSASSCNCSVCTKKALLGSTANKPSDLTWVKGEESTLTNYTFGKAALKHKFCPTCGVSILGVQHVEPPKEGETKDPVFWVNIRTLQSLDIWGLKIKNVDGKSFPPPYEVPKFTGTEPKAQLEGGKLYTGSCHCGAVKLAVKSKPFDETYNDRVIECNCSICNRYGALWIYPKNEEVSIEGEENLSYYSMGLGIFRKPFCRKCGVVLGNQGVPISEDQFAKLPEVARHWYEFGSKHLALNSRILNDVDLEPLRKASPFERADGWNVAKPPYENP